MDKIRRGRAVPISTRREIKARGTREVFGPTVPIGIRGRKNVVVMLQEGDSVPGEKCLPPPFEVGPAGLVDEDWGVD